MYAAMALLFASPVAAQSGVYGIIGGGFVYATQGREESPYITGLLGGPTFGIHAAAGVAARPISVEGEIAFHGDLSARQRTRTRQFETHHRDLLLSGLLRFNPQGAVRPLLGVTVAAARQRYTNAFALDVFGRVRDPVQLEPERRDHVGITAGLDVFARSRRPLQVGVTTRFTWLTMRTTTFEGVTSGLGSSIVRVGAAVKFGS